ncbi:DUF4113 domain-containing protein [Halomonas ventosae]
MLLDLVNANPQQRSLLDTPQRQAECERSERLMATLDELKEKMGRGTVKLGYAQQERHLAPALGSPHSPLDDELGRVTESCHLTQHKTDLK